MDENIRFDLVKFKKDCEDKISKINENINTMKDKKQKEKVENLLTGEWYKNYIDAIGKYYTFVRKKNGYKNKFIQYIDDVRNDYKKSKKNADNKIKEMENIKNKIDDPDKKNKFEEKMTDFKKKIEELSKAVKQELKRLKNFGGKKNAYRIETLAHSLLYCKQGKDVKESNKIGFLDYLLYISSGNEPNKKMNSKLRAPFFSGSNLNITKVESEVDNFIKELSKGTTDYLIDFKKIQGECNKISKYKCNEYQKEVSPIIEQIKISQKSVDEKALSKQLNSIVKQIAADLKEEITKLITSLCPDKKLKKCVTKCALLQAGTYVLMNSFETDGPLVDCNEKWKGKPVEWYIAMGYSVIVSVAFWMALFFCVILTVIKFWSVLLFLVCIAAVIGIVVGLSKIPF